MPTTSHRRERVSAADAVDISEVELARRVVADEQERLAREAMDKNVAETHERR
jgi:hypothetical protein